MTLDAANRASLRTAMTTKHSTAEAVRAFRPTGDDAHIHGVTFDGKRVWFARDDELIAFDPESEKVVRRLAVPNARAGTAFDGEHLYQLATDDILVVSPSDGKIVRKIPAPPTGQNSGLAWADGHLWVGQFKDAKIIKIDAKTGEIVKTLTSDRFVTGVSCVGDELWHGAIADGKPPELRRLGSDGSVEESVTVAVPFISGMERTKTGDFWCGDKGKLHLVRKSAT